jgi:hypothetical protein
MVGVAADLETDSFPIVNNLSDRLPRFATLVPSLNFAGTSQCRRWWRGPARLWDENPGRDAGMGKVSSTAIVPLSASERRRATVLERWSTPTLVTAFLPYYSELKSLTTIGSPLRAGIKYENWRPSCSSPV